MKGACLLLTCTIPAPKDQSNWSLQALALGTMVVLMAFQSSCGWHMCCRWNWQIVTWPKRATLAATRSCCWCVNCSVARSSPSRSDIFDSGRLECPELSLSVFFLYFNDATEISWNIFTGNRWSRRLADITCHYDLLYVLVIFIKLGHHWLMLTGQMEFVPSFVFFFQEAKQKGSNSNWVWNPSLDLSAARYRALVICQSFDVFAIFWWYLFFGWSKCIQYVEPGCTVSSP